MLPTSLTESSENLITFFSSLASVSLSSDFSSIVISCLGLSSVVLAIAARVSLVFLFKITFLGGPPVSDSDFRLCAFGISSSATSPSKSLIRDSLSSICSSSSSSYKKEKVKLHI